VTWKGRPGIAAGATVTLAPAPPVPATPQVTYSEKEITVAWDSVELTKAYNVYDVTAGAKAPDASAAPLNPTPLPVLKYSDTRMEYGKQRCYAVTSVRAVQTYTVESAPSAPACATPADTFPPAPPKGLAAVAGPGSISLIWDANTESDLAGYVVLRGEATGGTLQALTPEPIHETTFRDATARPGTTYVYAVVAVDNAKNMSAQSAQVQETAR
jgi:fibronectin type 3 domain-containing protein